MIHAKKLRLGLLAAALFTLQLQAQEVSQVQEAAQSAQAATAQPALSRGELDALLNAGASDVLALVALSQGEMNITVGGGVGGGPRLGPGMITVPKCSTFDRVNAARPARCV